MSKLEDALNRLSEAMATRSAQREQARPRLTDLGVECQARQYSDQMFCKVCALTYDVNDPDPPLCRVTNQPARSSGSPGRK